MRKRRPAPTPAQAEYRSDDLDEVARALDRMTFQVGASQPAEEGLAVPSLRRLLLAVDGSAASRSALAWAARLARLDGAELAVTCVAPSREVARALHAGTAGWRTVQVAFGECDELAEATLRRAGEDLRAQGLSPSLELQRGRAAQGIVGLAASTRADLVILGAHGHGAGDRLGLGSVGTAVKHHVPCSVLVARGPPTVRKVLLATDGSARARVAATVGLELARRLGAKPVFAHAVDTASYGLARTRQARMAQELVARSGLEDLAAGVPEATFRVVVGPAARRLRQVAEREKAGLIVVGSRGLGGLKGLALGSVSDALTHRAPASVLAVKPRTP